MTYASTVVPKGNIVLIPLEAYMEFLGGSNNLVQIADNSITLSLWDADNLSDESRIEEQGLPSSNWIDTDKGVFGDNSVAPDSAA